MKLPTNLDFFIAESAMRFTPVGEDSKDKLSNGIQKAIAILSSQGLFAMFLWSYGKRDYTFVAREFVSIFNQSELINFKDANTNKRILEILKNNLENFQKIKFFEDIAMQILIYARHYLKSL